MRFIRQSTAVVVPVGPFPDKTTGLSLTALTDQSASGRLVKGGTGAAVTLANWAYDGAGQYLAGLSAAHTNTVGSLRLAFADPATYLPVWEDFQVLSQPVYDALFGSTALVPLTAQGLVQADVIRVGGVLAAPDTDLSATLNSMQSTITTLQTNLTALQTAVGRSVLVGTVSAVTSVTQFTITGVTSLAANLKLKQADVTRSNAKIGRARILDAAGSSTTRDITLEGDGITGIQVNDRVEIS